MFVGSLAVTVSGEPECAFDIVGTWKPAAPQESGDEYSDLRYRFDTEGTVIILSAGGPDPEASRREVARAEYTLDDPRSPKAIVFNAARKGGGLKKGTTRMEITAYDDTSFTCVRPGSAPARWVREESHHHFIVLAARNGTADNSVGPAFPMLIKTDGRETQVDAVGTYSQAGKRQFGPVPATSYNEFMKEPQAASDVMLRLEITSVQYGRALEILETWKRRVREGALLYAKRSNLNNVVLVKAVAESLNACGQRIELYPLNWIYEEDPLTETYGPNDIPFQYFLELKRRNESRHVGDEKFREIAGTIGR
jgi:hypothetical protein